MRVYPNEYDGFGIEFKSYEKNTLLLKILDYNNCSNPNYAIEIIIRVYYQNKVYS